MDFLTIFYKYNLQVSDIPLFTLPEQVHTTYHTNLHCTGTLRQSTIIHCCHQLSTPKANWCSKFAIYSSTIQRVWGFNFIDTCFHRY